MENKPSRPAPQPPPEAKKSGASPTPPVGPIIQTPNSPSRTRRDPKDLTEKIDKWKKERANNSVPAMMTLHPPRSHQKEDGLSRPASILVEPGPALTKPLDAKEIKGRSHLGKTVLIPEIVKPAILVTTSKFDMPMTETLDNSMHKFRAKSPCKRPQSRPVKKEQEGNITKENEGDADENSKDEKKEQSENWTIVQEKMKNSELEDPQPISSQLPTPQQHSSTDILVKFVTLNHKENIKKHKEGWNNRQIPIEELVSWYGDDQNLRRPLTLIDNNAAKLANTVFRKIQVYMGDRDKKDLKILKESYVPIQLDIVWKGYDTETFRDEIYLLLCKQTNRKEKEKLETLSEKELESLRLGWELMATCLSFFAPSPCFETWLEQYIQLHTERKDVVFRLKGDFKMKTNLAKYAKTSLSRLKHISIKSTANLDNKPTEEAITKSREQILWPSQVCS